MPTDSTRSIPGYRQFRPIFIAIVGVVWFLLFWSFGYLVASQLPGEGPLSLWAAWCFFLVGFLPVLFFGAPATLMGFLQQHVAGAFTPPSGGGPVNPPLLWQAQRPNNPWFLGLNRLLFFWLPSVLLAFLFLWLVFPHGVGRHTIPLVLAGLGCVLAGVVAACSSGSPFFHEIRILPERRVWQGSFFAYLFWRHGLPWGIGNGIISAILALAVFPRTPENMYGVIPASAVSIDILATSLMLCFFMAVSAHPHAWVDARMGIISAPDHARSPTRTGRIGWFLAASFTIALIVIFLLKITGIAGAPIWGFVAWKGLAATVIAGVAAMVTAYWTLAREKEAVAASVSK